MILCAPHEPRPVLVLGAVYWADGGQRICLRCAGATATYTGHDVSGQPVVRVTLSDVDSWPLDLGPLGCEGGCTVLTPVLGPDGWPLPGSEGRCGGCGGGGGGDPR